MTERKPTPESPDYDTARAIVVGFRMSILRNTVGIILGFAALGVGLYTSNNLVATAGGVVQSAIVIDSYMRGRKHL